MDEENKLPDLSPDQYGIFRGEPAKKILTFLLSDADNNCGSMYASLRNDRWRVKGYHQGETSEHWVAFNNESFQCNVECFRTEEEANDWVIGRHSVQNNKTAFELEKTLQEDPNGDNLCICSNCLTVMIDQNPQVSAKRYSTENICTEEMQYMCDDDGGYWACPVCETDGYLMDL